ncbi:MAG: peptide transporter [Bacteroidetes bacterium]|nr:peptide transporter [Bacteroidota bacterium]
MKLFYRKNKYADGGSLNRIAIRKLKANKLAMTAFYFILFVSILSTLGYLITPDSTPYANHQTLELASLKPGEQVQFFYQKKDVDTNKVSFLHRMLYGKENRYQMIPINNFKYKDSVEIEIEHYTKSGTNGQTSSYQFIDPNPIKTKTFLLGTDRYGRDYLSRLIIGARVSLSVGFISVFISLVIGITLGSIAGYFGGKVDHFIVWLINVIWSIPTLLLVIAITFALGKGFWQVFIAVGLTMWVEVARVVRGQVLSLKEKEYVEAGTALGFKTSRIIFKHILPNTVAPVIVISAANFAAAILIEAGLSFLGIGIQPPMPSWGSMIKENYAYIILDSAYLAILPGVAIMLMVLAFMVFGNGLREALNVKSQQI